LRVSAMPGETAGKRFSSIQRYEFPVRRTDQIGCLYFGVRARRPPEANRNKPLSIPSAITSSKVPLAMRSPASGMSARRPGALGPRLANVGWRWRGLSSASHSRSRSRSRSRLDAQPGGTKVGRSRLVGFGRLVGRLLDVLRHRGRRRWSRRHDRRRWRRGGHDGRGLGRGSGRRARTCDSGGTARLVRLGREHGQAGNRQKEKQPSAERRQPEGGLRLVGRNLVVNIGEGDPRLGLESAPASRARWPIVLDRSRSGVLVGDREHDQRTITSDRVTKS
jgi:hypothetical protein